MEFKNLEQWIIDCLLSQNIKTPTPIQQQVINLAIKNQNIVGVAPTGTGKTLAFSIPILQRLDFQKETQGVIVAPTRELARQIFSNLSVFKKFNKKLRLSLLIGGVDINKQIKSNPSQSHIIVATPQRLVELMKANAINLSNTKTLVFDEADMLMDLGSVNEMDFINKYFENKEVQKLSFSATLHEMLSIQLKKYFKNTKIINVSNSIYENNNIDHYVVHNSDKWHSLSIITKTINPYLCIIFANSIKEVQAIYKYLLEQNKNVTMIHGSLEQRERKNRYRDVKKNLYQYVVASDLVSRGLDIDGASHIISWNLPQDNEWYVHRAGRSGRGKYSGESYVLYDVKDDSKLQSLSKKGIIFHHKAIKNNELVSKTHRYLKKSNYADFKTNNEVKKLIATTKSKVKPGYKKKLSEQIKKIEQKNKRQHIEKKMNAIRIKNYKIKNA